MWSYIMQSGDEKTFPDVEDLVFFLVDEGVLDFWFAEWLENDAVSNPLQLLYDNLDKSVQGLLDSLRREFAEYLLDAFENTDEGPEEGEDWKDYAGNVLARWKEE